MIYPSEDLLLPSAEVNAPCHDRAERRADMMNHVPTAGIGRGHGESCPYMGHEGNVKNVGPGLMVMHKTKNQPRLRLVFCSSEVNSLQETTTHDAYLDNGPHTGLTVDNFIIMH